MRQWNDLFETAVAPSPTIPTRRSSSTSWKRVHHSDSALPSALAMSGGKASLHQARSAGAAAKPMKNESVVELVHFFQTHEAPRRDQPSPIPSPTAPSSPGSQSGGARDIFKAGQRRLRQLAHRQRKDPDSKSMPDDPSISLTARQRVASPDPKSTGSALMQGLDSTLSCSRSLDSMRTSFKSEVENIGQPWLGDSSEKSTDEGKPKLMSPLTLDEFTSVIDITGSPCSNVDDIPSPYQQSIPGRHSGDNHSSTQQLAVIEEDLDSTGNHGKKLSEVDSSTSGSFGPDRSNHSDRATSVTTPRTGEMPGMKKSNDKLTGDDNSDTATIHSAPGRQQRNLSQSSPDESKKETAMPKDKTSTHVPSKRSFSQPLKLFPDPLPPRTSSRCAVRKSNDIQSLSKTSPSAADPKSSPSTQETKKSTPKSSSTSSNTDPFPRPHSSAQTSHGQTSDNDGSSISSASNESSKSEGKNAGRRVSLPLEMLSFPLPAPTRPLPALPKAAPADDGPENKTKRANSPVKSGNTTPRDIRQVPHFSSLNRKKCSNPNGARPISPMPFNPETIPVKGQSMEQQGGSAKTTAHGQPLALFDRRRHDRAERIRTLRTKEHARLDAGKNERGSTQKPELPSPVTPQGQQTRHESPGSRRRSPRPTTETGRCTPRAVATEPPTPPPRSPLPSDPPIRRPTGDSPRGHYFSSQSTLVNDNEGASSPDASRSPQIYRSNSTQSGNACHEATYSKRKHSDSFESTLPSSDDEGLGTTRSYPPQNRRRRTQAMQKDAEPMTHRSPSRQHTSKSPPQSPHSFRSQGSQPRYPSSPPNVIHSLESRIAQLEHQNRVLQAALMATLDVGARSSTDSLLSGLAASFSGSRASSIMGRSASSVASHSSSMDSPLSAWLSNVEGVKTIQSS